MDFNIIDVDYSWNGSLSAGNSPSAIIEHHAEASSCSVQDIDSWHKERGWVGIGYHYFIKKDGRIFKGRPDWAIGAHCPGFNDKSIGVCHEGNLMTEEMTQEQKEASIWLNKKLMAEHGITSLYQHGKVYPTSCAGTNFAENEIFTASLSRSYTPVAQVVQSDDRTWLQVGDSGDRVKDLQSKLSELGYTISVDGDYGKQTKNIVYKFQQDNCICADGLAGSETFNTLNAKIIAKNQPEPEPTNSKTLELQRALNRLRIADLSEDGAYGPATTNAVRVFQNIVGASVDGDAGSETWSALNYILSKPTCGIRYVTPIPTRYIQWRVGASIDGLYGNGTASAVRDWQSNHGLDADGCVGPNSWSSLIG